MKKPLKVDTMERQAGGYFLACKPPPNKKYFRMILLTNFAVLHINSFISLLRKVKYSQFKRLIVSVFHRCHLRQKRVSYSS